jgi:hypothetical protein
VQPVCRTGDDADNHEEGRGKRDELAGAQRAAEGLEPGKDVLEVHW